MNKRVATSGLAAISCMWIACAGDGTDGEGNQPIAFDMAPMPPSTASAAGAAGTPPAPIVAAGGMAGVEDPSASAGSAWEGTGGAVTAAAGGTAGASPEATAGAPARPGGGGAPSWAAAGGRDGPAGAPSQGAGGTPSQGAAGTPASGGGGGASGLTASGPADTFCDKYEQYCGFGTPQRHADRAACIEDFNATPSQQFCKMMHLDTAIAGTAAACNGMPSAFCFGIHCLHATGLPDPTGITYCK